MLQSIEVTGENREDAVEKALKQLQLSRDEVSVEVLEREKKGFLGFGGNPAKIRVSYDDGKPEPVFQPEVRTQPKPQQEKVQPAVPQEKPAAAEKPAQPRIFAEEKLSGRKTGGGKESAEEKPQRSQEPREKKEKEGSAQRTQRPEPVIVPEELGPQVDDETAQQIRSFLTGLLQQMECQAQVEVYQPEKERYKVLLNGDKMGQLIGRRGETLDAIQQLCSYCVNREAEKRVRIQVDAENYRAKREESLVRLADKVAGKVIKYRRNVTLEPMNAYERHVIHTALQDYENISTYSVGTEPNRRVVVSFDRNKQ